MAFVTMPTETPAAIQLPRFAVCLAAYNGMQFIADQVTSILAQTQVEVQIYISVDRSIDATQAFVERWAQSESRLHILPGGQRFGGAAPNFFRLLREVDFGGFDYVSYADQDDVWNPDKLSRACTLLSASGAAGYSSNVMAFWESGKTLLVRKDQPQRKWDYFFEAAGPGCTYVMRHHLALALQSRVRDAGEMVQSIDYHDWLTYAFARANNYPWIIDGRPGMQYRQHAQNQLGANAGWRSLWSRARKVVAGYGFEQALAIALVVQAGATPLARKGLLRGKCGLWWLALQAHHCRRKPAEQVLFFLSCLITALLQFDPPIYQRPRK